MNTANPQLEGLYLALAAINRLLVDKQLLTHDEIRKTLRKVEAGVMKGEEPDISSAHRKAVAFPIRLLVLADEAAERGEAADFDVLARRVGLGN
jgi:triphosphoribosyl-dephospho-CoA synthetase